MTLCDPCGHTAGWERPEARAVSQATQRPSWKMSLAPWWLERLSPPRRVRGLKISHRLACPPPRMLGQPREQGHRACPPDLGQSATRTINLTQPPQCVYTLTQTHVCSQVHSEVHPNRHKHTCSHPPAHTFQQCMHTHTHTHSAFTQPSSSRGTTRSWYQETAECAFSVNMRRSPWKELYSATQVPPLTQRAPGATQAPALSPHSTRPRWAERSLPPWLQAGQRAPPLGQRRASGPETRVLLRFCSKDARQPFLMSAQQRSGRTQPCAGRGQWAGTRLDAAQLRVCPSQAVGRQGRGPRAGD